MSKEKDGKDSFTKLEMNLLLILLVLLIMAIVQDLGVSFNNILLF